MKQQIALVFISILFALTLFPFCTATPTYQLVPNGSFETGDLTDWSVAFNNLTDYWTSGVYQGTFSGWDYNLYPAEGNFWAYLNYQSHSGIAGRYSNFCTNNPVVDANQTIDLNFNWGCASSPTQACQPSTVVLLLTPNTTSAYNAGGNVYSVLLNNVQTSFPPRYVTKTLTNGVADSYLCFQFFQANNFSFSPYYYYNRWLIDNVKIKYYPTLINSITTDSLPRNVLETGYIYTTITDSLGNTLTGTDVNVKVNFNSGGYLPATWDASLGKYKYLVSGLGQGTYTYSVQSTATSYTTDTDSGTWNVTVNPTSLIVNCIQNCSAIATNSGIVLSLQNNLTDVIFKVSNSNPYSIPANILWSNSDRLGKQYFIYTSSDGVNWVFSTTLTYDYDAINYDGGVQKIWDSANQTYDYNFNDTFYTSTPKYYKLVYLDVPNYWVTAKGSSDWVTVNEPTIYQENDTIHTYDLYADSNYTNIRTYLKKYFSDITAGGINEATAFVVQFTAFSDVATSIKVGRTSGGADSTFDIDIGTTKKRYSMVVDTANFDSQFLIKSISNTPARVYISDYAIIPVAYFNSRLELTTTGGYDLPAILWNSTSNQYLNEAKAFKFKVSAYDRAGDLNKLRLDILLEGTVVKTYEYQIVSQTGEGQTTDWFEQVDGVIDLNRTTDFNSTKPLRDVTARATLYNSAGATVEEQFKTVKLLQFPHFNTDLSLTPYNLNTKLGTNPKFSLNFSTSSPDFLIGFEVTLFTQYGLITQKYQKTIYLNELGCQNNYFCQKDITLNDFVYNDPNKTWIMRVTALMKTENKDYNNPMTTKNIYYTVKSGGFEVARIIQQYERQGLKYTNTESLPLILLLKDDEGRNTKDLLRPYMQLTYDNGQGHIIMPTHFQPQGYVYDETVGANYYYWDLPLNDIYGQPLDDASVITPTVTLEQTKGIYDLTPYDSGNPNQVGNITLSNRCASQGSGAFHNSILSNFANWLNPNLDTQFGCLVDANKIVLLGAPDQKQITIDQTYTPSSTNKVRMSCIKANSKTGVLPDISEDIACVIIYRQGEENLNGIKLKIGNQYSDYAKTDETKQYIEIDLSQEELIFNDALSLKNSLTKQASPANVGSGVWIQDAYNGIRKASYDLLSGLKLISPEKFPPTSNLDAGYYENLLTNNLIYDTTWDLNLLHDYDSADLTGVLFIKINGLKVINQADYVDKYPDLTMLSPTQFLNYAQTNNLFLPTNKTVYEIFGSDLKSIRKEKVDSPLIIYEQPKAPQSNYGENDTNQPFLLQNTNPLRFTGIATIYSQNYTKSQTAYIQIDLSATITKNTNINIPAFIEALIRDPVGTISSFAYENWFAIIMLIVLAIVGSLVYANISGGGKVNVFNK